MSKGTRRRRGSRSAPYKREKYLCTNAEWRFCQALQEAVGDQFTVMMQVRVGSLLSVPATEWKRWGRRVAQKSFDFALVKKGSSYVAGVVELATNPPPPPPKTHLLPQRRARDRFLDEACKRAGVPLLRFKTRGTYNVEDLREAVRAGLPKGACEIRPREAAALGPHAEEAGGWTFKKLPLRSFFRAA